MKIVGVLFDQHSGINGEAAPIEVSDALRTVRFIAPVVGRSAFPVAPEGSRVLLSSVKKSLSEAELVTLEGRLIAVMASESPESPDDCSGYFKRLGPAMPGFPAVHILENIGLFGDSLYAHFPSVGDSPSDRIPSIPQMWRVSGILYS